MPIGTLFVSPEWHQSEPAQRLLTALKHKHNNRRRQFCILEKPSLPAPYPDVFEYKIFLSGKPGVGKSSIAAKLSASEVCRDHNETLGIEKSTVYWLAEISEVTRVVLFKIQLWDAGDNAIVKYDHLSPAVRDKADGVMFVFSFTDKSSFTDLPHRINRTITDSNDLCKFVIGTKLDKQEDVEVTQASVIDFESRWSHKVLHISNIFSVPNSQTDFDDVAPALNYICDQLWQRDRNSARNAE